MNLHDDQDAVKALEPSVIVNPEEVNINAIIASAVDARVAEAAAKATPAPVVPVAPVVTPAAPTVESFTPEIVRAMVNDAVTRAVKATGDQFESRFVSSQRPAVVSSPVAPSMASGVYTPPTIVKAARDPQPFYWAMKALLNTNNNKAMLKFALGESDGELEFDGTADAIKAFKAMATTTGGNIGEHFIPRVQTNLITEALYQDSIIRSIRGLITYPMAGGTADMPGLGTFAAAWSAENAAATAAGDATTSRKQLIAKKLTALATLSNEILVDSNPGVEPFVRKGMASAIGVAFDVGGFTGDGIGVNPLGLLSEVGVTATAAGTDDFYTAVLKAIGRIAANKVPINNITVICRPEVVIKTLLLRAGAAGDFLAVSAPVGGALAGDGSDALAARLSARLGYPVAQTTVLPVLTTASPILVLKGSEWVYGDRQELDMQASNVAGNSFANDQTMIRAILRADFRLMRPQALEVITGFPH